MSPVKLSNNERKILINLLIYEVSKLESYLLNGEKKLVTGEWIKDCKAQHEHIIEKLRNTYTNG